MGSILSRYCPLLLMSLRRSPEQKRRYNKKLLQNKAFCSSFFSCVVFVVPVFFPGGHAAADMTLCLVDVEHAAHAYVQLRINSAQPIGNVLMYRRF